MSQIGNVDSVFVSSLDYVHEPDVLRQLIDVANEKFTFLDVIGMMNDPEIARNPSFRWNENLPIFSRTTLGASLPAQFNIGDQIIVLDATTSAEEGKTGVFNGTTFKASDGTTDLALVATDVVGRFSSAHAAGGDAPGGRVTGTVDNYNNVQIIKTKRRVSEIEQVTQVYFGEGNRYYMYKEQIDAFVEHRAKISNAFLIGPRSAQVFGDAVTAVQTTGGMDSFVTGASAAVGGTVVSANATETGLNSIMDGMVIQRAPKDQVICTGHHQLKQLTTTLTGWNGATNFGSNQGRFQIGQDYLDLGIKGFTVHGFNFYVKDLPVLDHPGIVGVTTPGGSDAINGFHKACYFVPMGALNTYGGGSVPYLRTRYMPMKGKLHHEHLGGLLAPNPTSESANLIMLYSSIVGLQCAGANHFGKLIGS